MTEEKKRGRKQKKMECNWVLAKIQQRNLITTINLEKQRKKVFSTLDGQKTRNLKVNCLFKCQII